jgi:hypothetical protein
MSVLAASGLNKRSVSFCLQSRSLSFKAVNFLSEPIVLRSEGVDLVLGVGAD